METDMNVLITGGCKNGKTGFAQDIAVKLSRGGSRYYVATMIPCDGEDRERIARHIEDRAFMMCMTMFCYIPCPFHKWDEDARPLMTLFLPIVGAWIGILWTLTGFLVGWLGLPLLVRAAILCAFPFLVTGGMHMDGYLDVTDAVRSWRELDECRRIPCCDKRHEAVRGDAGDPVRRYPPRY